MKEVKYIKTSEDEIIVFSALQKHSEFKSFNPVSAGFIDLGELNCYGYSVSLGLHSDEKEDSLLAKIQFGGSI